MVELPVCNECPWRGFMSPHAVEHAANISQAQIDYLTKENKRLRQELDAAQLRSIEARNPGIDMDEVRRSRAHPKTQEAENG